MPVHIVRQNPELRAPNVVAVTVLLASAIAGISLTLVRQSPVPAIVGVLIGIFGMQSPKIAQQWEAAIVLRLGRFRRCEGLASSGSCRSSIA